MGGQPTPYISMLPVGGCLCCVASGGPGLLSEECNKVQVVWY